MEHIERERLVSDAIILERAARVFERRFRKDLLGVQAGIGPAVRLLQDVAEQLRQEAGYGVPSRPFPVVPAGQIEAEVAADVHRMGWTK